MQDNTPEDAAAKAAYDATENATQGARQAASDAGKFGKAAMTAGEDITRRAAESVGQFTKAASESQSAMLSDMTRRFTEMRFPSMIPDSSALLAAHRRNMEVLSSANRLALEGAQAVARRHMEIMQQTMAELSEHVRELAASDSPQAKAARQAELVKRSYEHAVANIRELSDLIQHSNSEALGVLNARFKEAMDEVKGLLEKSGDHS